ncbi:M56 family metallopeptidase [Actinomadura sp. DC4]|uniref:M56 family metallopeptidase n=1 Tax=Actinomadura sp. DC4 TaxID=3055069 RepID=UPI0025B0C091|nr:M56 family metallopeptidase [Actinomadura sp. DC4]MDN3355035.1 M56 family metallopeptidase [Actinomadura sp. DC4]
MVDVDGYLPLVSPMVAALAARPLAEHLPPRTASWLLTVLAAGLALCSMGTLLALAGEGPAFAALLGLGLAGAGYTAAGQVRALRATAREVRELPGGGTIAVVADDRADAYAVPGRVVVSTGMLAALDPAGRRVLFAHEFAHLTGRHHVFRAVVRVAAAANPLLWPLEGALWYTTERWADERAAAAVGDRVMTARVIGAMALAYGPRAAGRMGIGAARPGPVPRRVAALLRPPPRRGLGLVAAALALLLCTAYTSDDLLGDLVAHARGASAGTPVER